MLSILSLQVHISIYIIFPLQTRIIASEFPYLSSKQKMSLQYYSRSLLTFVVALFAVLASTHLINPNPSFLRYLNRFSLTFLSPPLTSTLIPNSTVEHHNQHKKHPHKGKVVSACDDFPPDFPPPETDTTSYICVDQNGCCNFTTVQAAVDAVPDLSLKRTIIWINTGIYL